MENKTNIKNYLRICYSGLVRYIKYRPGSNYQNIIKLIVKRFSMPPSYEHALLFTSRYGNILNQQFFERFIERNPNPDKIFYVRLDYAKLPEAKSFDDSSDARIPFGLSKNINKRRNADDGEESYPAVPVFRQNCFLGSLFTNVSDSQTNQRIDTPYGQQAKRFCLDKRSSAKNFKSVKLVKTKKAIRL